MRLTINGPSALSDAIGTLRQTFKDHKYFTLSISTGKKRTLQQNSLLHSWFLQVSKEEKEYTPGEVKCLCKYQYGLPILRGADEYFNSVCVKIIDPLPYESRIAAMEFLPVTSLMSTKQLAEFLEAVQRHYAGRVDLIFPDEV